MDLSDIIYIICLALGIFLPILQNKEKKKAQEEAARKQKQQTANEEYTPSPQDLYAEDLDEEPYDELPEKQPVVITSLDDIFKALREGKPLVSPTPQPRQAVEEPVAAATQKNRPYNLPQEGIRSTANTLAENEISDNGIYEEEPNGTIFDKDAVDWRQAVVASEILNRKY